MWKYVSSGILSKLYLYLFAKCQISSSPHGPIFTFYMRQQLAVTTLADKTITFTRNYLQIKKKKAKTMNKAKVQCGNTFSEQKCLSIVVA